MPLSHVDEAHNKPVPVSPVQANPSNLGSPEGSFPDLDAMGRSFSPPASDRSVDETLDVVTQWMAKADPHINTLVQVIQSRFNEHEQ